MTSFGFGRPPGGPRARGSVTGAMLRVVIDRSERNYPSRWKHPKRREYDDRTSFEGEMKHADPRDPKAPVWGDLSQSRKRG